MRCKSTKNNERCQALKTAVPLDHTLFHPPHKHWSLKKNKNETFDYDTIMMMKMMVVVVVIASKLIFLLIYSINNPNIKE